MEITRELTETKENLQELLERFETFEKETQKRIISNAIGILNEYIPNIGKL